MLTASLFSTKFLKIFNNFKQYSVYIGCPHPSNTLVSTLPNEMKVATEEKSSPITCISLFVSTGPRFESESLNGMSHFIEHMCYKGARSMSKTKIDRMLNETGAKLSAHTTREYQYFSAVCSEIHVEEIVSLFSTIALAKLDFPSKYVETEKKKIQMEACDRENDPKSLVFDYLHQTAFQGTSLGQGIIAPTCNLNSFDACCATSFMKENFQPMRMLLATVGNVCHANICSLAENVFHFRCESRNSNQLKDEPKRYTGSSIVYRDDSMPFAHVAVAVEAPGYLCPDYLTLYVANFIMHSWDKSCGRGYGNASYLARASAVGELCVRFQPFYKAYRDVGLWGMYYVSEKDDTDEMMLHVQERWMNLCTTVTENEVKRAVNLAKMALFKNVEGVLKSCHNIGKQVIYTSKIESLENLCLELTRITPKDIKYVCDKYIYDKCPVVAAVGPTEVLTDYARVRGQMYWLRL